MFQKIHNSVIEIVIPAGIAGIQAPCLNYFHYRNSNQVLEKVKTHAEQRLRKQLMKRYKIKDRGIGEGRFPSVDLYGRYGLYKVPTAAGWRSAHA